VSNFAGPVGELIAQQMLQPPARPGLLAQLDRFEVQRLLGAGGMGIVLLARDTLVNQPVALKLIRSDLVTNQGIVHRFLKEAGHLKRLQHPHVVPVAEISTRAEGPYFVMPYFARGSLAAHIKPGEPLDTETILALAGPLAEGLAFAHRNGIIHRDLKPANILLADDGRACLADFGLARTMFNDSIVDGENRNLEGTAPYMSPAVAAGEAEDTRCDIYSFGAVLYEMLTGHAPYKGRGTKDILQQIIAGPPRPVRELNPRADAGLVTVAEGCLARELRHRYADMRDVANDLQRLREQLPANGPRGGEPVTPRRRHLWLATAAGAVLLAGGAWLAGWFSARPASETGPAPDATSSPTNLTATSTNPAPLTGPTNANLTPSANPPIPAPVWTLTTLAGQTGVGGYVDGSLDEAEFRLPNALAVTTNGDLYLADTANFVIRHISPGGVVNTLAGIPESHGTADGSAAEALFWAPFGLAADGQGNVFVADTANDTIRRISPDGTASTFAGQPGRPGNADGAGAKAGFRNPWGLVADTNGNLYVADLSNDTIRKITSSGKVTTLAGRAGRTGAQDGAASAARFNAPAALALDATGNLYVADSANDCIRKISPRGQVTTVAGLASQSGSADGVGPAARFNNPEGLAVDPQGNLFVADTDNDTIRRIAPDGTVTTLVGQAGLTGAADGGGSAARLNHPTGLALDTDGALLITDANNQVIRKLALTTGAGP
jgi:serine/threonine protein kinase/streptogramin lyase